MPKPAAVFNCPSSIIKRDGTRASFDVSRIQAALVRAGAASGEFDQALAETLTAQVLEVLCHKFRRKTPGVEAVQDVVEQVLISSGHLHTARAYIVYREQHQKLRQDRHVTVEVATSINEYLSQQDWRVNANANQGYSLGGLILNVSGKMVANYWLNHVYPPEVGQAHREADIHVHDLDMLAGYCAGWSLRTLLNEGLNGVPGKVEARPPKHLSSAVGQMVNFLGTLQNEWAGAQAFSSVDTYLAPYIRRDNLPYEEVRQSIQELIYNLNVPSRWGTQTPFTNFTFDWVCPEDLREQVPVIGGEEMPFSYGDLQPEMDMINQAYIEVMAAGDAKGRVFTFPIPTYNMTPDFPWESPNAERLFDMTAKYGLPYFQNFINSELKPNMVRSMCPLTPDTLIFTRNGKGDVSLSSIKAVVSALERPGASCEAWTPDGWRQARPVKTPATKVYEVLLSNGVRQRMGANHLQPVRGLADAVAAKDLSAGMWLPFNRNAVQADSIGGSAELGFALGAFLGDGSRDNVGVVYSLSDTKTDTLSRLRRFWCGLGYRTTVRGKGRAQSLRVGGNALALLTRFFRGSGAADKRLAPAVFNQPVRFRQAVLDGLLATDGSRSRQRLYTASIGLRDDILALAASLGLKALARREDSRPGRLGRATVYRIDLPLRERYGELFDQDERFNYYRIESVAPVEYVGEHLYCLEVADDTHLFTLANGLVTHNCRLQLDLRELLKRGNGLFGSAEQTGSVGVVTINCARLGYLYRGDEAALFARLDELLEIGKNSLEIKREVIQNYMDAGLFPYTKRYLGTLRNHFSTLGVNGINEMIRNFSDGAEDITTAWGYQFALRLLDHVRARMLAFQDETGHMYNLEATPAEGTTYRFAKEDRKRFPDILQAGTKDMPYYTNSSQLPVGFTDDPFEALERQEVLQKKYTGGTVLHLYMTERLSSAQACKTLVKRALERFGLPYITVTPTFSICPKHGYLEGEYKFCPKCDQEKIAEKQRCMAA